MMDEGDKVGLEFFWFIVFVELCGDEGCKI